VTSLALQRIEKKLGGAPILRGIDLHVASGELVVLVGPSGCGKSTLLRTVAGLELPDSGSIRIGDREVTWLPPRDRDVGMVFQSYALYPHLTVRDNLAFGLSLRKTDKATIDARVREVSAMLGLQKLLDRYPRDMSGGQRQRVAMGRAIARRPSLFLFDEPLSNLDAALRAEVRIEIKRLHARLSATMLYVTHDQVEAMTLADRLVVLRAGVVEQVGAPLEVYAEPASRFVAGFLGSPAMNFLAVRRQGDHLVAPGVSLRVPSSLVTPDTLILGVRPHDVRVTEGPGALSFEVDVVEAMGFEAYAHGQVGDGAAVVPGTFVARLDGAAAERAHRGVRLSLAVEHAHLFDAETERSIGRVSRLSEDAPAHRAAGERLGGRVETGAPSVARVGAPGGDTASPAELAARGARHEERV
jgi:sn-glycerol 3-phosphate transport system ATP-binding protein/multiple sugar transport system ATP-binding protein